MSFGRLGVRRGGGEVDVEIVLHLVEEPKQEADEDDDFEDDEFDLSQPVAELGEAVGMARRTNLLFRPKEIRPAVCFPNFAPAGGLPYLKTSFMANANPK